MKHFLWVLIGFASFQLQAQELFRGKVINQHNQPLSGVEIIFGFPETENTTTDAQGFFTIPYVAQDTLQFHLEAYDSSTFIVSSNTFLLQKMYHESELSGLIINAKRKNSQKSLSANTNTTTMNSGELLKAACCNLAESFETNPSIDVNFSDAVSGTKQIKMLGLTSPYILITEENIPTVRGASQAYGLNFTPGTWVESIQVTKGAGSVVNGYESISGQINTELIKPATDIPFYLNLYGSTDARFEVNAHFNEKINERWSSTLLVHGNARVHKNDTNNDGFLDNPLGSQINVMNRWQYLNQEKGWIAFLTARYMKDEKQMGQTDFNPAKDKGSSQVWGSEIHTDKVDAQAKLGYVFPDMPFQSIGFQNSFSYHKQNSYFGHNVYDITQRSWYSNLIFNSIIQNTKNKFATGINFVYDTYDEWVVNYQSRSYDRTDQSVGAFFEYTYDNTDNFAIVLGGRLDQSNRLGLFATPRVHLRYNPWDKAVVRASIGRGKRLANIFSENQALFASSRVFQIHEVGGKAYGMDPEIAWNYGLSFSQGFMLFGRNAELGIDLYRTDFENQIVVDIDQSAQSVSFYNLDGQSFAHSVQVDATYNLAKHLNLRTSYKYYDIQTQYEKGKLERPLQAKHRVFANIEYETHQSESGGNWRFDATWNWLGKQRLPYTGDLSAENQLPNYSNPFSTLNAQITKVFNERFEMYLGGENLTNYTQKRIILGADQPFGAEFDSTIGYAPLFGTMYYAGLRFKVK